MGFLMILAVPLWVITTQTKKLHCRREHDMTDRVKSKVAFITGAGSGIGRAAAVRLAGEGAKVAIVGLTESHLKETANEIAAAGGESLLIQADIAQEADIIAAYRKTLELWGAIDIIFANAGINGTLSPIELLELEEWNKTIQTNLTGTFLTVKHGIAPLKDKGGSIIITSSINGNRTFTGFGRTAYSTSKAGQVAFAKMAALELAKHKIRVNTICPGAIETNINNSENRKDEVAEIAIPVEFPAGEHPLKGAEGDSRQVANLVLFLASDESDHITGTDIYIDGAESLLWG
jgi:NAD(P)-dependent dehydrogenase (short-subunit alcohol dehydrogenase family)